jgi:hypothetical protein
LIAWEANLIAEKPTAVDPAESPSASQASNAKNEVEVFAEDELHQMEEVFKSEYSGETPLSMLLYQPVGTAGAGRLVDIGPKPQASSQRIEQQASSGRTGLFLNDAETPYSWVPNGAQITEGDVSNYVTTNPDENQRKRQVSMEALRYRKAGIKFPRADAPPKGAWIFQQRISPRPEGAGFPQVSARYPGLGVVYTLCSEESGSDISKRIPLYALAAGDQALKTRLNFLLNDDKAKIVNSLIGGFQLAEGKGIQLIGTLLLAHHWFYPHDPVAWHLLHHFVQKREPLSEDAGKTAREQIESIYNKFLFSGPMHAPAPIQDNVKALVGTLTADIIQLCRYSSSGNVGRGRKLEELENIVSAGIWTMLHLITGRILVVEKLSSDKSRGAVGPYRRVVPGEYVSLGVPEICSGSSEDKSKRERIPTFEASLLLQKRPAPRKSAKSAIHWITPGATTPGAPGARKQTRPSNGKPKMFVSDFSSLGNRQWNFKADWNYEADIKGGSTEDNAYFDFARTLTELELKRNRSSVKEVEEGSLAANVR